MERLGPQELKTRLLKYFRCIFPFQWVTYVDDVHEQKAGVCLSPCPVPRRVGGGGLHDVTAAVLLLVTSCENRSGRLDVNN